MIYLLVTNCYSGFKTKKLRTSQNSHINELDARLAEAVSKRDFQAAAAIQAEIETIVSLIHKKRDLETEIREAVKQRDWAKASEVQAKIDSLETGKSIILSYLTVP